MICRVLSNAFMSSTVFFCYYLIIAWAMTLPFFIEVYASDHFCFIVALPEYDAYVLVVGGIAFQRVRGARMCVHIAFPVIDGTVLHYLLYFRLGYLPAVHTAAGMIGVFQVRCPAVEPAVA